MENEPDLPKFLLDIGEEKVVCTPENTIGSLYENEEHDYIFYITEETDEAVYGYYIFRHLLGKDFDILVKRMIEAGFAIESKNQISEQDYKAYLASLPVEPTLAEITERQQHHIDFLHYLLEKELIIDEEFYWDGELYI